MSGIADKDELNVTQLLIELKEDVSSIKANVEHVKEQNGKIEEQGKRLGNLETKVSQHESNFKLLWYTITGILIFLGADILAPLIVNWLSK